jgi:predicted Zn finger-like uncharacterized protein
MSNLAIYTTNCPACRAKQRVNPQAFKLAAGKVNCERCGCMFDAKKHRQQVSPSLKSTPKKETLSKAAKKNTSSGPTFRVFLKNLFWFILCCISLMAAAYQLIVYKQQDWVNIAFLNPVYQKLASIDQIELKASDHFRQLSLVIEPAQEYSNVTIVAFSFQNISTQEQALPKVQLTFSDLKGNRVSQRVFESLDYLPQNSSLINSVAPAGIISAKIEILQPALRGVNYQLQLLTP